MEKKKSTHGGKRPGAGRKAPLGKRVTRSVVVLPDTLPALRDAGIHAGRKLDELAANLPTYEARSHVCRAIEVVTRRGEAETAIAV